jgi:hypothetical protein
VIGPFFIHEKTMTDVVYLDMLQNYVVLHVHDGYIFQQDGAAPHFWTPVTEFLNEQFTGMWIS